jgi:RNA polymerase sigma factor (sigma-70 family)
MPESDDITLLKQYAGGDESAFTTLFERHVHLVYSAALRQASNPSHAEEITQAVFILLARKAKSLSPKTVLSGWLYQAARLTTANLIKREIRRQRREQEMYMQTLTEPDVSLWEQVSPLLDEAMGRLGEKDRNAIVLRFFENRTPQEVAAALKLNETTARKRVSRALEKLRALFAKRGVILTAAIIAGTISGNSVQGAPAALANSATAIAIARGAVVSGSTLTLVKGALKVMAWTKMKTAVITTVAVLLTGSGTGLATFEIIHAIRVAHYPNIQGDWEGVMPLGGVGIKKGESVSTRIVMKLSKKSGKYTASFDAIDLGQTDLPMSQVVYDFPTIQLAMYPKRNMVYQGKVNASATRMNLNNMTFRKISSLPAYMPLVESDFAPGAVSDPQGYWKGAILPRRGNYPDGLGDLQLDGTGDPMDASNSLPINLKIAGQPDGTYRAEFDNPMQGEDGQPASVTVDQGNIKLALNSNNGMLSLVMDGSGQEMSGSWIQGGQSTPAILKRANYEDELAQRNEEDFSFSSPSDLPGHWKGSWNIPLGKTKINIPMQLDIAKMPDGTYSVAIANLEQLGNNHPIPASNFEYSQPDLHAEWKWAGGTYDGRLENGKIVGTWSEGGGRFALVFERTE